MNKRTLVLTAVLLLVSAICASAQVLDIEAKEPTVSLLPTATPTPSPSPSPIAAPSGYGLGWMVGLIVMALITLAIFLLRSTKKEKEPELIDEPETPVAPKIKTPEPVTELEIATPPPATPATEVEVTNVAMATPTTEEPVLTDLLDQQPTTSTESAPTADETAIVETKVVVAILLALGLSFAQAGNANAATTCSPKTVVKGEKIAREQKGQFVEIRTSGCSKITAIGIAKGVEFTSVSFFPQSGRLTATVKATKDAEAGKFRFKLLDAGTEITSPADVTFTILGVDAALVHNEVEEVKATTQKEVANVKAEVKKGIAAIKGELTPIKSEVATLGRNDNLFGSEIAALKNKIAALEAEKEVGLSRDQRIVAALEALKAQNDTRSEEVRRLAEVNVLIGATLDKIVESPVRKGFFGGSRPLNKDLGGNETAIRDLLNNGVVKK
jgi:hypothetical protein